MGDFLLDFRDGALREESTKVAGSALRFCSDSRIEVVNVNAVSIVLSSVDNHELWGSCSLKENHEDLFVGLSGRIAMDDHQWEAAKSLPGEGGLACRAIANLYRKGGTRALDDLNGNYAVIIFDGVRKELHLTTDRFGMMLCYSTNPLRDSSVLCSHPDVLADVLKQSRNWDQISLAQFVMTGCQTFPHTNYHQIQAAPPAFTHSWKLTSDGPVHSESRKYFHFEFSPVTKASEGDLAKELAEAFRAAVKRRTARRFGPTSVALSGGLDSRAILSTARSAEKLRAFTLYDEPNAELQIAERLARVCEVPFQKIRREPDFYAASAALGIAISGGAGLANNHFLGARTQLLDGGVQNLLTGCYCDYLFKGLAFNTHERKLSRVQSLAPFRFQFYRPHFSIGSPLQKLVVERLHSLFPEAGKSHLTECDWLQIHARRTFPLAYESDSAQRVIPQRVMPWYPPAVDNDLLRVYAKLPIAAKLNAHIFKKMLTFLCPREVLNIQDNNTGAPVNAGAVALAAHQYVSALSNRVFKKLNPLATRGSWPNWYHYIRRSPIVHDLWNRPDGTKDILANLVGNQGVLKPIEDYPAHQTALFLRLLTLKVWLNQRINSD